MPSFAWQQALVLSSHHERHNDESYAVIITTDGRTPAEEKLKRELRLAAADKLQTPR